MTQAATQQHERAVLTARDVLKTYGGVTALAGVDITLRAGEIHAVVGENGAGKSTLVKVLCGVTRPDRGEVSLDGRPCASAARGTRPRRASRSSPRS